MGATIQRTRYLEKEKLILTDDCKFGVQEGSGIKTIGGMDILTNNQVSSHGSEFSLFSLRVFR
jgi:hypothetical protein